MIAGIRTVPDQRRNDWIRIIANSVIGLFALIYIVGASWALATWCQR